MDEHRYENHEIKSMHLEVKMLKNFPHPLVIKYIDSFKDSDENAYLVTEFAEASDLKSEMLERFNRGQGYSDSESKNIVLQFCLGLLHMH